VRVLCSIVLWGPPYRRLRQTFFDDTAILGNCLAGSSCGSLPAGTTPAFFGKRPRRQLPPAAPGPPYPSPPPVKLGACPTGTGLKDAYLDTFNGFFVLQEGRALQLHHHHQPCRTAPELAPRHACAGNPVDFFMHHHP